MVPKIQNLNKTESWQNLINHKLKIMYKHIWKSNYEYLAYAYLCSSFILNSGFMVTLIVITFRLYPANFYVITYIMTVANCYHTCWHIIRLPSCNYLNRLMALSHMSYWLMTLSWWSPLPWHPIASSMVTYFLSTQNTSLRSDPVTREKAYGQNWFLVIRFLDFSHRRRRIEQYWFL